MLEALTGFKLEVKSLEKDKVISVQVDEVIQPGQNKAIPGEGMPIKGRPGHFGNLVVIFDVTFPEHLNMEMKEYLKILLDPKSKNLKKIPTLDGITKPTFETNNTNGLSPSAIPEQNNSHIQKSFLPGHYNSSKPPVYDDNGGIFSFLKKALVSSWYGTKKQ